MKTLKRLLTPIKHFKSQYIWYTASSIYWWVVWPMYALFVSKAIKWIELEDFSYFKTYVLLLLWLTILNYALNYAIRTSRKVTVRLFQKTLYEEYLSKYLKSDNNKTEWLWTWKSNSIISKWCDNWQRIVMEIFSNWLLRVFITIVTVFTIIIFNFWWIIFLLILAVFIIMMVIARFGNKRMKHIRDWSGRQLRLQGFFQRIWENGHRLRFAHDSSKRI